MYQFASFNNKPFGFLYKTTATKKEQQNVWVWHNLFDRKVFLKIKRENRIKCIVCNWSIFLKAAYNFVIFFCICVLSSVCNLMHLWQSLYFLDKFFLYSSTYAWLIPYHIIEVKSSRENMKKKVEHRGCKFRSIASGYVSCLPISVYHLNNFNLHILKQITFLWLL